MTLVKIVGAAFIIGIGLGLLEIRLYEVSPAAGISLFVVGNAVLVWGACRIHGRKAGPDETGE